MTKRLQSLAKARNLCFNTKRRFSHDRLGWNFRITNLQAALGVAQLEKIGYFIKKKDSLENFIQKTSKT